MTLRANSELPPQKADALLIWPRNGNTGDMLILSACEQYLRDRGVTPWISDGSVEEAALAGDQAYLEAVFADYRGLVFFPGGGNIGIYPNNGRVRAEVIAAMRVHHRCLVFPQSALQAEPALIDPRVTVWCRDAASKAILDAAGASTALVPDAALYMDTRFAKAPGGSGIFYVRRRPGGDTESIAHGIEVLAPSGDLTFRLPLTEVVAAIAPYDTIVSDRLHGGLIALMMRKKVALLPVGYHKIKSFYETWLTDLPNAAFAETQSGLGQALASLQPADIDFTALFCAHADPAFDRFLLSA